MKKQKIFILIIILIFALLIIGVKDVYAQNGPAYNWAVIELYNDNYDRVYDNGETNNSLVEGMTYDEDTNTLTLTNYKSSYGLYIAQMGEDFKINLVGENEIGHIYANEFNDTYTCNLHFTGYGSLTVNKERDGHTAIDIYYGKLIVDDTVTLKLYVAESENPSVVCINDNIKDGSNLILLKNGDKPNIKNNQQYYDKDVTLKSFAYLEKVSEPHVTYTIVEKDNKKFGMRERWGEYYIKKREVRYDSENNKYFFAEPSEIDYDETFPAYNTLDAVTADGYTITNQTFVDDSFVIYTGGSSGNKNGTFTVKTDKDNIEHVVFSYHFQFYDLYYAYDITDSKITLDNGEEYTVLKRNKEINLDDLTTKRERVYYDEYSHFVPLDSLEVLPSRYEVTKGANQKYTIGKGSLSFTINADYSYFENGGKVFIDGNETDKYTSKSGSTIIEFNDEYLNTLSEGEHTIRATFNNGGYAQTEFTIKEQEETVIPSNENTTSQETVTPSNENTTSQETVTPSNENTTSQETVTPSNENEADITTNNLKTGDNIAIWISLSLASMVSFVGTKKVLRKKKSVKNCRKNIEKF